VNPYKTLGVKKNATEEEIKEAYRTLAKQHHPDVEGGNEEKFKQINEAYAFLTDQNKRKDYDETGVYPSSKEAETINELITLFRIFLFESTNSHLPVNYNLIHKKVKKDILEVSETIEANKILLEELKNNMKAIRRKKTSKTKIDCFKASYNLLKKEVLDINEAQKHTLSRLTKLLTLLEEYEQGIIRTPARIEFKAGGMVSDRMNEPLYNLGIIFREHL
jgi:DnaJ-domain-containing protein 1